MGHCGRFVICSLIFLSSDMCLAVSAYDELSKFLLEKMIDILPWLVSTMAFLRGVSSLLFWVSKFIPQTRIPWQILDTVIRFLGLVIGHWGVGMPKDMVIEKAAKARRKDAFQLQ